MSFSVVYLARLRLRGGIGDVINWTVAVRDTAGNEMQKTCELRVIKK